MSDPLEFTDAERDAWEAVSTAAGKVMCLVEQDRLHGMDAQEFASAFHVIQDKLLARPAMRKLYAVSDVVFPK